MSNNLDPYHVHRALSVFKTVCKRITNLIGIQSVKHSLDQDHAGHYVGLDLGLNFLLKKKVF